nr:hypothetical protein [uncultured bacterium]
MLQSSIPEFQHQEHQAWLKKIDFYQEQIQIFQKELSMVLHQHIDLFSIIEHVDEYRMILLKKLKKLDELRRQIILHEKNIAQTLQTDAINLWDHMEVRAQLEEFEKKYDSLKKNFRNFVAHHIGESTL